MVERLYSSNLENGQCSAKYTLGQVKDSNFLTIIYVFHKKLRSGRSTESFVIQHENVLTLVLKVF